MRRTFETKRDKHSDAENLYRDNFPTSLEDSKGWESIAGTDTETVTVTLPRKTAERIHDLAAQNWVIKAQAGARKAEDMQDYVASYVFGEQPRGGSRVREVVLPIRLPAGFKLTAAQLEELKSANEGAEIFIGDEQVA